MFQLKNEEGHLIYCNNLLFQDVYVMLDIAHVDLTFLY